MEKMIPLGSSAKEWLIGLGRQLAEQEVVDIQYTERTSIPALKPHMHPLYRIMWIHEGSFSYKIFRNNELFTVCLHPGNVLFCARYGVTACQPDCESPDHTMFTLVFFPQHIRFLVSMNKAGDSRHYWYHTRAPMPHLGWDILNSLNELLNKKNPVGLCRELVNFMLKYAVNLLMNDMDSEPSKACLTYQSIKEYMMENLHLPINRKKVGQALNVNPSHISKLFKRFDETNFNASLRRMRMELAMELVREKHFTISEIAEQCGFVNTGYFIKSFHDFYGKSPGSMRNQR